MLAKPTLEKTIKEAIKQLERRGIKLQKRSREIYYLAGYRRVLPKHDEKVWFRNYFRDCTRGQIVRDCYMSPEEATREAYALLRYKQYLAGMSDGSSLGAVMGLLMGVGTERAKEAYREALQKYDRTSQR